ncbi:MAG: efflux RND transporter periplasmic adaptor subunit [Bacteroidota bacterium]
MQPKVIFSTLGLIILAVLAYAFWPGSSSSTLEKVLTVKVRKGEFVIKVSATGELKAKRSEKIRGPQGMRSARIYQTTISDMVSEGTLVKKGDYVATLDKTELDTKMKEAMTEIEKIETQLEAAKIDTAIELRGLRDELINLNFSRKEKELEAEQSKYEAPMVIQKAKIELERSDRDFKQLQSKYSLSQEKAQATISEILASLRQNQNKLETLSKLSADFMINAPKDGMVIYARNWNGKVGPGSQISTWDPIVAELPDLSDMVSKTFVNEVDISRVKKGQEVQIKVDAFPKESYSGQVIKVANIGEQLRNYDSKVFEVTVQLLEVDSILRPAMTTANEIITDVYKEVLALPIEALQTDSLSYVFKSDGRQVVKQEIVAGLSNDDEIMVDYGLSESDEVLLTKPANADELPIVRIDEKSKKEVHQKQEAERKARAAITQERMKAVKDEDLPDDSGGGGGFIIFN